MYDNLKNYATKALIVSALLGGNSVMMPAFAAGEHGMAAPASDGRVKGTVTDAKGEPLTGVVVRVVGADVSYAAVTDIDGKFNIKVPNKKSMLEIRGVGYKTKRVSAQDDLNIKMEEDISNLNEVVVIGYGTLDKKEVTSAITSIKGKDLMVGVGGADVSSALQGKISGLVMNNVGSVNSETTFQLRESMQDVLRSSLSMVSPVATSARSHRRTLPLSMCLRMLLQVPSMAHALLRV